MSFFAKRGTLAKASVTLTNASPSQPIYTSAADEWLDVYSIVVTTTDTAAEVVTVSDGTTALTYAVGGGAANPPIVDESDIPVRFRKGATITVSASAITSGHSTYVNVRALVSKT